MTIVVCRHITVHPLTVIVIKYSTLSWFWAHSMVHNTYFTKNSSVSLDLCMHTFTSLSPTSFGVHILCIYACMHMCGENHSLFI